jgi:DNA helicase-2/ATP-dependent DNA helicase PcrA
MVSLMTIHLSKGLEFPVVHLVGLKKIFPKLHEFCYKEKIWKKKDVILCSFNESRKASVFLLCRFPFPMGENYRCRTFKILSEIDDEYIEFLNPMIEKRLSIIPGVKSNIFDEHPSEMKSFKKVEKENHCEK